MSSPAHTLRRLNDIEALDLKELTDLGLTNLWIELDNIADAIKTRTITLSRRAVHLQEQVVREQQSR